MELQMVVEPRPREEPSLTRRDRAQLAVLVGPTAIFLALFFVAPLGIVLIYSFLTRGPYGQLVWEFNLGNYVRVFDPLYLGILWRSFLLAAVNTLLCLLIAYPF